MAFIHSYSQLLTAGGRTVNTANSFSGAASLSISETVATTTTDMAVVGSIDISEVKSLWINASQDMTLETNVASAAEDTINLQANIPYIYNTGVEAGTYYTNIVTNDVTTFYLTTAGNSATATFDVEVITDPTP